MRAALFKVLAKIAAPLSVSALSLSALLSPAYAQTSSQAPATPPPLLAAMADASEAVVGVKVTAVKGARSVQTLGQQRSGSGVVIGPDALILTIGYLMLEADQIEIITPDGKTVLGKSIAYDLATGFGLIKPLLPSADLNAMTPVKLANLNAVKPGESLFAATGANQSGDGGGVSLTGLVSRRPFSGSWEYHLDSALFTSPPVASSRGNHSGAPLFNQQGELVGIGSLLVADASGAAQNAAGEARRLPGNMFVPVDLLQPILAELQRSGSSQQSQRPWLGVTSSEQGGRIQVMRVAEGSPADEAGLQPNNIIQAINGTPVATLEAFYKRLWSSNAPGGKVTLTVEQAGTVKTLEVTPINRMLTLSKPAGI